MSCRKIAYTSRAKANKKLRQRGNGTISLRVYYCLICHYWHITKQEARTATEGR
jgi:hypothetical protein